MKYVMVLVVILTAVMVHNVFADDIQPIEIVSYVGNDYQDDTIWLYNPNDTEVNIADHEIKMTINGEQNDPNSYFVFEHRQFSSDIIPAKGYVTVTIGDFSSDGYTRPHMLTIYNSLSPDSSFAVLYENLSHIIPLQNTVFLPMVTN